MTHSAALQDCLEGPYLRADDTTTGLVDAELAGAEELYQQAKESWEKEDIASTLKQSYGAMFRAARALVFAKGYRPEGYRCLETVLKAFWLGNGKLSTGDLAALRHQQGLNGTPAENLEQAGDFVQRVNTLLSAES